MSSPNWHALSFCDCLRHVSPAGTDLSSVYRDSCTRFSYGDILYSQVAFRHTWVIVKHSFSFSNVQSLTLTLALLQVAHPDLTFLCGRLIRIVGISTSSIINSFLIVFIQVLVCRSGLSRKSCSERCKIFTTPEHMHYHDVWIRMRLHCRVHFRIMILGSIINRLFRLATSTPPSFLDFRRGKKTNRKCLAVYFFDPPGASHITPASWLPPQ